MVLLAIGCAPEVSLLGDLFAPDEPVERPPHDTATEVLGGESSDFPFDGEGRIFEIEMDLPPDSVAELKRSGDYVPGTFSVDGLEAAVGVRLKGSSTFDKLDGKPSFKLSFDFLSPRRRFLGMEHVTLNGMKYDQTKMREAVAYRIFARQGVPAPRHGYASLTINGEDYGLYSVIETLDEHLLKRVLPDDPDGNLYDTLFTASDLTNAGLSSFSLQEGDPATAYADLEALVRVLDTEDINTVLRDRFDHEAAMRYLAVDLATGNYDGYSRNTNNYLLYHATLTDRWYFVPWGQDTAFGGSGPLYTAVRGRITAACQRDAECRADLEAHVRDVFADWEADDLVGWAAQMAALVAPACEADPHRSSGCDQEQIVDRIEDRPEEILREIGP